MIKTIGSRFKNTIFLLVTLCICFSMVFIQADFASSASKVWDFSVAGDYTYDSNKIEIVAGKAQLKAAGTWYNSNWGFRKPVTIDNTGGGALTDYQVSVSVTYESSMQADFDDIRFTDDDQTTLIDHWREEYTASTSATFWVEVPSIDAASNKTIYMYYGNSNEITQSNGSNTFLFFDNFNNSIDWQYSIDGDEDVWFHSGAVYDGSYFSGNDHAPYRMQQWDVDDGTLLQSQDIAGAVGSPPLFIGDYMYFHAGLRSDENTDSKLYKMSISNFSVYSAVDIQANSSVEVIAADNTYLYISEADKVSKRLLSDLSEFDSFAAQSPRGILRKGTKIYFKTLDNYFMVVDTVDMTEDWKIQLDVTTADTSYSVPIYDQNNNRFYAVDSNNNRTDGNVYSINPDTHSVDWTVNYVGYALTMTPAFKDDVLYVSIYNASGKGYHKALDITDGGNEIWSKQYDDDSGWGSWVLDDNYMYTIEKPYNTSEGDPSYFLAVDQSDGSVVAKEETDYTKLCNTPIITKGKVIVGTAGAVYAFNIGSGSDENVLYYHGDENYTNYYQDAIDEYFEFNLHNKWTHGFRGGTEIRDGYLESLSEVGWNSVKPLYNYPEDFVVEYKFNNDTESTHMHYFRYEGGSDYVEAQYRLSEDKMRIDDKYGGASHITDKAGVVMDSGVWNEAKYVLAGQNIKEYFNGANEHSVDLSGENASVSAELGLCYSATGRVDDYRVRKYAATEPTASLGAETGLYDNGSPTIYSKSTVSQNFTSLSAFSETAIKNGGEIKYQLSNNGGTTWYWHNGTWQVAADNYAQTNTAAQVNTNIASFPVGNGKLCFRAYLNSSGSQLVQLDSINVTYLYDSGGGGGGDDPSGSTSEDSIITYLASLANKEATVYLTPEFAFAAKSFSIECYPYHDSDQDQDLSIVMREGKKIKIYTQRPIFQGKTIPNAKLIINIASDKKITDTIYSDNEGNWEYQVEEDLEYGNHTIQIVVYDSNNSFYYTSAKYEFEILKSTDLDKEGAIEKLEKEIVDKNNLWWLVAIIGVVLTTVGIYYYQKKKK
jgi:hypothetical protein